MNNLGQMKISFSMIFSVILIIAFIAFAIYSIAKFLSVTRFATIEDFKDKFQNDVNKIWKSQSYNDIEEYSLPKDINQVCFKDDEYENIYFIPNLYEGEFIKNIDMEKTLSYSNENPKSLCINSINGKVKIRMKKEIYDKNGVTILK